LVRATSKNIWIETLKEFGISLLIPRIYCYNQSAVTLTHYPQLHGRNKHMKIVLFFVRGKVLAKQLTV